MTQDPNQPSGSPDENYASEGYDPNGMQDDDGLGGQSLEQSAPSVSAPQNRMVVMLLVVVAVIVVLVVMLMGGDDAETTDEDNKARPSASVAAPVQIPEPLPTPAAPTPAPEQQLDRADLPPLPLPPVENLPPPPPVYEQPQTFENPADIANRKRAEEELRQRRLRSSMVVGGGALSASLSGSSGPNVSSGPTSANTERPQDPNLQFSSATAKESEVEVVTANLLPDGKISLAQGKVIEVVLESAINTDMPAPIRAIVSRDIYAEAGRNVMVPKGSRVIGRYNTSILRGQRRVFVIWTRIMRPDGTSIAIHAPGLDQLGRAGVEGVVDNKYLEVYSAAILTSMLTIGTAVAADQVVSGEVSTSNNSLGGSSSTGTAGATAVQQSISDLGSTTRSVVTGIINVKPTITLDQGTRLNIFVNQD
jgi:type IV secretion system protein VirB10